MKVYFAGDDIEIKFTSNAKVTDVFEFKGVISKGSGSISNTSTAPTTSFDFCSKWWLNAISKQISKAYKNMTFEEILHDIIEVECGGTFFGSSPTPEAIIERYVTPYWTPAHILKDIMTWANGLKDVDTGYTLYDNLNDSMVYNINLNNLLEGEWFVHPSPLVVGSNNIIYEGNVENITMESYYDTMRYLNQGALNTEYIAFDYDNTKIYKSQSDVQDVPFNHLASTLPINKEYIGTHNSIQHSWGPPVNQKKRLSNKEFSNKIDGYRNNLYSNLFTDMLKFNVICPGATDRSCGQLVKLNVPSINSQNDNTARHKFLEGMYLVRNINHIFKNDTYTQVMTLCRDGFGDLTRDDLIPWKNVVDIEDPKGKS